MNEHSNAVTAVARVARALVGAGSLHQLGGDALGAISDALDLNVVAMYTPDPEGPTLLRLFEVWPDDRAAHLVVDVLPLEPAAWQFLAASAGPLVLRDRDTLLLDNPFQPRAESWVALPLVVQGTLEGAVFGSSAHPISLDSLTRATLGSIADLLSAGVATTRLRLEAQRTEIQRERLALVAELHDGLAQDLALAVREVAFLEGGAAGLAARASTQRLGEAVRAAHRVVRAELEDLAVNVSEPGLAAAIATTVERFRRRGMDVGFSEPLPTAPVEPGTVAVLIRILNEALVNVERHSGSDYASVTVAMDGATLVMRVSDHGVGLDAAHLPTIGDGHFGVAIMRARALAVGGAVNISGTPGEGTVVELRLPIAPAAT